VKEMRIGDRVDSDHHPELWRGRERGEKRGKGSETGGK